VALDSASEMGPERQFRDPRRLDTRWSTPPIASEGRTHRPDGRFHTPHTQPAQPIGCHSGAPTLRTEVSQTQVARICTREILTRLRPSRWASRLCDVRRCHPGV